MSVRPPIRYLSESDTISLIPSINDQISLVQRALRDVASGEAHQPPKMPINLGPGSAFAHAMPACIPSADSQGRIAGAKWISGGGGVGIGGVILVEKSGAQGVRGIVAASALTAIRTAAVSGAALRLAPPCTIRQREGAPLKVAIIGGGVQAFSHRSMLEVVTPGARVAIYSRRNASELPVRDGDRVATSVADACTDADVIITAAAFGTASRDVPVECIKEGATIVCVDYAVTVTSELVDALAARGPLRVITDCASQFNANRAAGNLGTWDAAHTEMGSTPPLPVGGFTTTIVNHLGISSCDLVLADALLASAEKQGVGVLLPL